MTFWNWRRGGSGSATSGSAALANGTDLAPIELYTADTRVVGWIASKGRRVTDLLTESDELRLWQPRAGGDDVTVRPMLDKSGEWRTVPTADVVLVMPPEWRTNRQLRLHRRIQRVAADAGQFTVTRAVASAGALPLVKAAEAVFGMTLQLSFVVGLVR